MLAFPTSFPLDAATTLYGVVTGTPVDRATLFLAAWNLAGYGMGQTIGHGAEAPPEEKFEGSSAELLALTIEQCREKPAEDGAQAVAIPWVLVIQVAWEVYQNFIKPKLPK